jgi:alpha-tubulin suppressor-like RCC1 family protein
LLLALAALPACAEETTAMLPEDPCAAPRSAEIVDVTCASSDTCVVMSDGRVRCWGAGSAGQLGTGYNLGSWTPVEVAGLCDATNIDLGSEFACALTRSGRVLCWGDDFFWELGNGPAPSAALPGPVVGVEDVHQLSSGGRASYVVTGDQSVFRWGIWDDYENDKATGSASATPVPGLDRLPGLAPVVKGGGHACVVASDGGVWCWGANSDGQLGTPTRLLGSDVPLKVPGLSGVVQISLGDLASCALLDNGQVYCWGSDDFGTLGNGPDLGSSIAPTLVVGLDDAAAVDVGAWGACAIRHTGSLVCWGRYVEAPELVPGLTDVRDVSVGTNFMCALTAANELYCWGENNAGELGLGDTTPRTEPTLVLME